MRDRDPERFRDDPRRHTTAPGPQAAAPAAAILALQRSAGNAAVGRLLTGSRRTAVARSSSNEFLSIDEHRDPRSWLPEDQEETVQDFVDQASWLLAHWDAQRGASAELRFAQGAACDELFRQFHKEIAGVHGDAKWELLRSEAARRLKAGRNVAILREVRLFSPDLLGDYARLLELEDAEPSHCYRILPLWSDTDGLQVGTVARGAVVMYENTAIPGLSWQQEIELTGYYLRSNFKFSKHGAKKADASADELPIVAVLALDQPRAKYLGPAFFADAEFTSPSGSLSGAPAGVQTEISDTSLVLRNKIDVLQWGFPATVTVGTGLPASPAGFAGEVQFGDTSLVSETQFKAGEWTELEDVPAFTADTWVPLHVAVLKFETGSTDLDDRDDQSIDRVIDAIVAFDHRPDYAGSLLKLEVIGCHSRMYEQFDTRLQDIEDKALDGTIDERDLKREKRLEAAKQAENEALALARAQHTHELLQRRFLAARDRLTPGLAELAEIEPPSTRQPEGDAPTSNWANDRSAIIRVSYGIYDPLARLNTTTE